QPQRAARDGQQPGEVAAVAPQRAVQVEADRIYHLGKPNRWGSRGHAVCWAFVSADELLAPLNDEQRAAVAHFQGPALVLAGAGSGKTRTVVHRIAYLLAVHDVLPQQVLAVTFTNKAAGELKERVEALIGTPGRDLWVSTFHSACLRVLRTY